MAERTSSTGSAVPTGLVARVAAGLRYMLRGNPDEFFGPGQPVQPVAQEAAAGRQFDFASGYNLSYRPRGDEPIDFPTMRALAESYDVLRLAIETRKDQMGKLKWIVQRRDTGKQDAKAKEIQALLLEPDREHDFLTWKRMLHEDLLVIDAPTVYIRRTRGGQPFAFEVVDGSTIRRVLNADGRTPLAPDPAYQQVLKGLPAVSYSREELVYKPRNPRPHKVYGYSPVEQIIMTVNIALRRQLSQLQYYTEGNVPDMFASVPATWTPAQVAEFQTYWDELLAGDMASRRRIKFMPGDMKLERTRAEPLFDPYDEWLARIVSYAFSLPPGPFVKQQNRATAETSQEVALEEGLAPLMEWEVGFMNRLIRLGWDTADYEFTWLRETDTDPLKQAQIDDIYIKSNVRRVNEVRADHGWEPDEELEERQMAPPAPSPFGAPGEAPASGVSDAKTEDEEEEEEDEAAKAIAVLRAELLKLEARVAAPDATAQARAFAALVEHGVPANAAMKAVGLILDPIDGGDVGLVSATRIPLSLAGDPAGFVSPPAPAAKVAKAAPPVPAPAPIIVTPAAVPAPNIEFRPEIHIHEAPRGGTSTVSITKSNGDVVTGEISHGAARHPTES